MNQEVKLLGLFLELMGGGVGCIMYPSEKWKAEKSVKLLAVDLHWGGGVEDFYFFLMLCHSKRIFWGSSPCVCSKKLLFMVHVESTYPRLHPLTTGGRTPYYNTEEGSSDIFHSNPFPGKKDQSLPTMSGPQDQGNKSLADQLLSHYSPLPP